VFITYKKERNEVVRMISEAQSTYYRQTIDNNENKNRDMCKSINKILDTMPIIEKQDYELKLPTSIHELVLKPIEFNFALRELTKLNTRSNLDVLNIDSKLL